jgi:IMP dehydrogenase
MMEIILEKLHRKFYINTSSTSIMFRDKLPLNNASLTFRDVVLVPGRAVDEPSRVDLSTYITRKIKIRIPLVSSPMDTVTERDLAISMARYGGVGVIHRNMTMEAEVEAVKAVKEAAPHPLRLIMLRPEATLEEAVEAMLLNNVDSMPIVNTSGTVVGILRRSSAISGSGRVMDAASRPVVATPSMSDGELLRLMRENGLDTIPVVDSRNTYIGSISFYDLREAPSLDSSGRLLVGAAVSPFDLERAKALSGYADFLVIDVAHADNDNVLSAVAKMVKEVSVDVVLGNIGTYKGALDAVARVDGVAGLRVGIASGSICSTGVVTGAAAPTLWATAQVADALLDSGINIPVIADGGIREPGDAVKAFAAGAWAVMMGRTFAQALESPSPVIKIGNKKYKYYRGMGSEGAREARFSVDRYGLKSKNVAEGIEGLVPYRGTVRDIINYFVGGMQAAMGYIGAMNIHEAWEKGSFNLVTSLGWTEVAPHDLLTDVEGE